MSKRTGGLGKGLSSLLPDTANTSDATYFLCPIDAIQPNAYQPRQKMNSEALEELAASIADKGILQPLVVREIQNGSYELIAGERRLRAAKLVGLAEVPVIRREADAQNRLELALIENIQRQNLNPLEEAEAYRQLIDEFDLTQEEVAKQVGKKRSTVTNTLRILLLPDFAREDLVNGSLTMGHARVLLSLDNPENQQALRDEIVNKGLSVRQAEALAKRIKQSAKNLAAKRPRREKGGIPESYCKALGNDLVRYLGSKAKIIQNGQRGKVEIEYYSLDDLERLMSLIVSNKQNNNN